MIPTPGDVAARIKPPATPTPVDPNAEWIRCSCGKIYSESRTEAERKAAIAADRHHRHCPVRFYMCEQGAWHWSEKFTAVLDCECGHRAYVDERSAAKAANRRTNRERPHEREKVHAVTYQCAQLRWHVILYPVTHELRFCDCGAVAYPNTDVAGTMLTFLNDPARPGADLPDYVMYLCPEHATIHIARPDRVPANAYTL